MTAQIVYRLEGISKQKIVYKAQHVIAGTKSSKNKDEAIGKQKQTKYLTAQHSCSLLMIFTKQKCGLRVIEMNSKITILNEKTILIIGCIAQSLGRIFKSSSNFTFIGSGFHSNAKFLLDSV